MTNTSYAQEWAEVAVPPAPSVIEDQVFESHDDQVAAFRRDGFLLLRGFINADLLSAIQKDLAWACANHQSITPVREGFNVEDPSKWPDPNQPVFRKVGGLMDLSDSWHELCVMLARDSILPEILGPKIDLWRDVVMMKQAAIGREKPWHQDGVYWPFRPFNQVSAFCPLDPCTKENGALQVIPGTHLYDREHFGAESQITLTEDEQAAARYVLMEPGDVLFFHSLLLHGSEPNKSGAHRRVAINSYMQRDLTYTGPGEEPQRPQVLG